MTKTSKNSTGQVIRKISMILSLLAVVSLVFASSSHAFAPDAQVDMCMDMAGYDHEGHDHDGGDHKKGHAPLHEDCTMQSCPYCFPMGETASTVLQVVRLDFTHILNSWRPIEAIPFKRPPRVII